VIGTPTCAGKPFPSVDKILEQPVKSYRKLDYIMLQSKVNNIFV